MALLPQPPVPPTPPPLDRFWLGVGAAVLAVASAVGAFFKHISARWRGIVVAHLFFLTLWLAIQVFFFATGAYWCIPGNGFRFVKWLTASFPHVARCGPTILPPFKGTTTAVVAPVIPPPPPNSPPSTPVADPVTPPVTPPRVTGADVPGGATPPVTPPVTPPRVTGADAPGGATPPVTPPVTPPRTDAPPPPAVNAPPDSPANTRGSAAKPPPGPGTTDWSARSITNCWRNRAVGGGDCYNTADQHGGPPPPSPPPPPRWRWRSPYSYHSAPSSRWRSPYSYDADRSRWRSPYSYYPALPSRWRSPYSYYSALPSRWRSPYSYYADPCLGSYDCTQDDYYWRDGL